MELGLRFKLNVKDGCRLIVMFSRRLFLRKWVERLTINARNWNRF